MAGCKSDPAMKRKTFTALQRAQIFRDHSGICALCGRKIAHGEEWDIDHTTPLALGGSNELENLTPAHVDCHRGRGGKTAGDVKAISKADRLAKKHAGVKRKSGFRGHRKFIGEVVWK